MTKLTVDAYDTALDLCSYLSNSYTNEPGNSQNSNSNTELGATIEGRSQVNKLIVINSPDLTMREIGRAHV